MSAPYREGGNIMAEDNRMTDGQDAGKQAAGTEPQTSGRQDAGAPDMDAAGQGGRDDSAQDKSLREEADRAADDRRSEEERRRREDRRNKDGERLKGLFAMLKDLAIRAYRRIQHAIDRAIGRGKAIVQPAVHRLADRRSAMDQSQGKDPSQDKEAAEKSAEKASRKEERREFRKSVIARWVLGKDVYLDAVHRAEKQAEMDAKRSGPVPDATKPDRPDKPEPDKPDRPDGPEPDKPDRPEPENPGKTEPEKTGDSKEGPDKPGNGKDGQDKGGPKELGEDFKFTNIHQLFTMDLETEYADAQKKKQDSLDYYAGMLQQKLTELNKDGGPVLVTAARNAELGSGTVEFHIEPDRANGAESFMGLSDASVRIDSHMNVDEAFAHEEGQDGKKHALEGNAIQALGAYVAAGLARNFFEDYNKSDRTTNIVSRNELGKLVLEAAGKGTSCFRADNIDYMVSAKDGRIEITEAGSGRKSALSMDAFSRQAEAAAKAREIAAEAEKLKKEAAGLEEQIAKDKASRQKSNDEKEEKGKAAREKDREAGKAEAAEKIMPGSSGKSADDIKALRQDAKKLRAEARTINDALLIVDQAISRNEGRAADLREKISEAEKEFTETKKTWEEASKETGLSEFHETHKANAIAERESCIRAFEEILPECRNSMNERMDLCELDRGEVQENGRTCIEDILDGKTVNMYEDLQHGDDGPGKDSQNREAQQNEPELG